MGKTHFLITLCSAMLCGYGVCAQNAASVQEGKVVKLDIQQMFTLADERNSSIKAYGTAVMEAREGVKAARSAWLPDIDVSVSASYNGDGTVWDRDFKNIMAAEIPDFGNSLAVGVSQVLYTGGAIKSGVEISATAEKMARLDYRHNREQVRFLIVGNYIELCKVGNHLQVLESHIAQTGQVLEQMKVRVAQGAALQNDVTRMELMLQNLEYNKVKLTNARKIINARLNTALGLEERTIIEVSPVDTGSLQEQEDGYWRNCALNSAYGIQMARAATQMSGHKLKMTQSERLPKVALYATNSLNGPVTFEIPVLDKNFNYWGFGIGLKYNLGNLYKSGKKIRQDRLAVTRAVQQEQVAMEGILLGVEAAEISYNEAHQLLQTKLKGVELAIRNYDLVSYRYNNGLALITDLLDASSQKLDAQLQEVNARMDILYNYYRLQYISGTL